MKTSQFYKYATWLLLTLNLLLIAFFFFTKPGPPRGPNKHHFRNEAIELLKLSSEQETAFIEAAEMHNTAMDKLGQQGNSLLKSYFEPLLGKTNQVGKDSLMTAILDLEKAKIEGTFQHFSEVKDLLDDDQGADFDKFMRRAIGILLLEQQKKAPPHKD